MEEHEFEMDEESGLCVVCGNPHANAAHPHVYRLEPQMQASCVCGRAEGDPIHG